MRSILFIVFIILICCDHSNLRLLRGDELVEKISDPNFYNKNKVEILSIDGSIISRDSLATLWSTGRYFEDYYVDHRNEIVQIRVRKRTDEDGKILTQINNKLNEIPMVSPAVVDCQNLGTLLNDMLVRDQNGRSDDDELKNLQYVIGIIESCGMPTLSMVNRNQLMAIWLVIQHAPLEYQQKYIHVFEESAQNGDLAWEQVALMRDRILMRQGKPQLYGSQIKGGKLYDLADPHLVDQRRGKLGMGPLHLYLARYGIEFEVVQN